MHHHYCTREISLEIKRSSYEFGIGARNWCLRRFGSDCDVSCDRMDDDGGYLERLARMGVFGLSKEAVRLMRHNFPLFLSFVTTFTIPCSIFTIFLLSAIDLHHHYVIDDFISPGELVIFRWKFATLVSPLALNFAFIILNLLPVAWLNAAVCTRGVVSICKSEDYTTSIKNSFLHLQWAVLRLVATQSVLYVVFLAILGISLIPGSNNSNNPGNATRLVLRVACGICFVLFYHLPASQVAVLERRNYGFRGVYRAMEVAFSRFGTFLGLALFSVAYFSTLKVLVDTLLKDTYPFWTKFLVYPPLVISGIAMSVFWPVVYTLFYLSKIQVDLDKVDQPVVENISAQQAIDINQPLLGDGEVENSSEGNSSSHHVTV